MHFIRVKHCYEINVFQYYPLFILVGLSSGGSFPLPPCPLTSPPPPTGSRLLDDPVEFNLGLNKGIKVCE